VEPEVRESGQLSAIPVKDLHPDLRSRQRDCATLSEASQVSGTSWFPGAVLFSVFPGAFPLTFTFRGVHSKRAESDCGARSCPAPWIKSFRVGCSPVLRQVGTAAFVAVPYINGLIPLLPKDGYESRGPIRAV
jgi:hypothetical protein